MKNQLRAPLTLKSNILKTKSFIDSVKANTYATKAFIKVFGANKGERYEKIKPVLEFGKGKNSYLFELGFIALFANFEFFMYDILKELFLEYKDILNTQKTLKYGDICEFEKVEEISEYAADSLAIEKSYDIKTWTEYLKKIFSIDPFPNEKEYKFILAMNHLRNLFLHSGGITNSKFRNDMKQFLKITVPLNERADLPREKLCMSLYSELFNLTKRFRINKKLVKVTISPNGVQDS